MSQETADLNCVLTIADHVPPLLESLQDFLMTLLQGQLQRLGLISSSVKRR